MAAGRKKSNKPSSSGGSPTRSPLPLSKKLLFSAVTVVVVLLLLELTARTIVSVAPNAAWETHRHGFTTRGFPALEQVLEPDDKRFWTLQANLADHSLYGRMEPFPPMRFSVSTDTRGLRLTPNSSAAPSTVLFLGDSCTFGLGVDDDETVPAQVQNGLDGVRVVNGGIPGYTAYQGNVFLRELTSELNPDVVVITFGFNDDLQWDNRSDLEHAETIAARRSGLLARFRFVDLLRTILPARVPDEPEDPRPRLTDGEFDQQIRAMVRWSREHDIEPVLMAWPMAAQIVEPGASSKQRVLEEIAREEGVRLVNLVHAFRARGGTKLFRDAVHANPAGCRVAAGALVPVLREALAN
jgi:lysophospholipase L1-like esterase